MLSCEEVQKELLDRGDDLSAWAAARPTLFPAPDADVTASLKVTSKWATAAGYTTSAIAAFLAAADYYLVAHAHAHELTVVTHETRT